MLPRTLVLALIACAPSSLALAQTQTTEMQAVSGPGEIDRTTQTEDVRFKTDATERMTVPVKISGAGPFRFLIDTGADRTAVSRELASRMKFASAENASLHSLSGVSTVSTATVPSLQLTRKEIRNINAPLLEGVNIGADGILGTDSLRSQRVLFDFEAQTLSVVP
ncbi:MAG TPA: retropepsin-like aspartic protease, partial [Sphingomicrobium sp.]